MLTIEELKIVTEDEAKDAINKVLQDLMLFDGRFNVNFMTRAQMDYAIHLLRQAKAFAR